MTDATVSGRRATRHFASPLSRAMASRSGLDLASLRGSGPQGRIVRADVLAALAATPAHPAGVPGRATRFHDVPNTLGRKLIARRLTQAKQDAPHFYLSIDCQVDALQALRASQQARAVSEGVRLSLNDFVIKAAALALRDVPELNASFSESSIRYFDDVHVAVAVALDDGLVTPVIEHADRKSIAQIAVAMAELATQARAGALPAGASAGGTFSISNLGAFGVREFAAVINPPQAAILAVGAAEARPVVLDGQMAVATVMTVTLSVDHRVTEGAVAARWLAAFRSRLSGLTEADVWLVPP
jgi:pyruvate dehydrogenase E2 component (dihydrolipoamide acetyltransferase)